MFVVDKRAIGDEIILRSIGVPEWRTLAERAGAADAKVISGRLLRLVKARASDMMMLYGKQRSD